MPRKKMAILKASDVFGEVQPKVFSRPRGQITYAIQSFIDARVTKPK